ncbi:MAG: hypothetical protein JST89_01515 [Cyanobacteria bacterium SZAS-4]|nr:hypothetical protein [Cyanobacteria bacterium SZAS-4]
MAHFEQLSDKFNDRSNDRASNPDLYFNIHDIGPNGKAILSWSAGTEKNDDDLQYIDLSANPYSHQSEEFDKLHPWRAEVLDGAEDLRQEMRSAAGHLNGHYADIRKDILAIKNDEERFARENGGEITAEQKASLLRREKEVEQELHAQYAADNGTGNGHGHQNPPGDDSPGGGTTAPGGGTTQPPYDGNFMLGTTVIPGDMGTRDYHQALVNFDARTSIHSDVHDIYANENLGKVPDLATMQKDIAYGTTPMLSLRTIDYKDVLSGKADEYLKLVADDLKAANGEVLLRPNWEMDGSKNQQFGTAEEFKASWKYMHDFMEKQGVTNIKWVFTPNAGAYDVPTPSWAKPARDYYPGNDYVDYIGSDGYCGLAGAGYQSPEQVFQSGVDFANEQGKPFFIGEAGVSSTLGAATDAKYIRELTQYLKTHPEIVGMAWFSENENSIFTSAEEEAAFIQMEKDLGGRSS